MQFFSTRDQNRKVTSSEAIAQGLSNEGGLFVPESFPQVDVKALCELDYPAMAAAVIKEYLTDYSQDFLTEAARSTYGDAFGGKAGYLVPVEGDTYALELWHGPTCAFKDYALQLMPKLLVEAKKNLGRTEKTLILVATSGDTGKAALDGYHDIPGVEIAVFYPTGGTSEIQRLQMATQEGANVAVYAVRGNFDDAQTGVKKVFGDKAIAAELGGWLTQRGIGALWGLYGVSMGGAVALRLLADGKIPVRTCVLDAAITPYRAPRWLTRGFSLRNYLVIRFAQRHLALIRRAFPSQRFGQAAVEDVCMILGRMDRRDVWRVFDSCFYYPLPKQLCTAARVSYWYGEKEYSQRALDIRHVRRLLPEAVFVPFPDCAHAEFVSGQPEAFAARLAETLERD